MDNNSNKFLIWCPRNIQNNNGNYENKQLHFDTLLIFFFFHKKNKKNHKCFEHYVILKFQILGSHLEMSSKMCELLYKNIFGAFQIVSGLKKNICYWAAGETIQSSFIIIVHDLFKFWTRRVKNPFNVTLLDSLFKTWKDVFL